jgi:hypothetical protein
MNETDKSARIAGGIYLLMVFTAPFSQLYLPAKLIVHGDAAATAANVIAHETLFRFGIVADMATHTIFIAIVLALYRLFARVDNFWSGTMVALVLVSATIGFVNVLTNIAALILFQGGDSLNALSSAQLNALGTFFLRLHGQGNNVDELFWGLWLFPFGLLVMRSGFLPRFLGVWLILNGVAYVVLSITSMFDAAFANRLFGYSMPLLFGELVIAFWLVIRGAKPRRMALATA